MPIEQVTTTQRIEFQSRMAMLLQPMGSDLVDTCKDYDLTGQLAMLEDFFGAVTAQPIEARHVTLPPTFGSQDRLWLAKPFRYYTRELINDDDQLVATIDLKSGYMMANAAAIRRYWDVAFLRGFLGPRLTSLNASTALIPAVGTTSVPFPSGQVVPANVGYSGSGSNHLNVRKMQAAREVLALGNVDFRNAAAHMIVTPKQITDLFNEVQITSSEFTSMGGKMAADGVGVERFMGFQLHEVNLNDANYSSQVSTTYISPTTSQTVRKLPFWAGDAVAAGWWGGRVRTNMSIRDEGDYETQLHCTSCVAVTRTQDGAGGFIEAYEG